MPEATRDAEGDVGGLRFRDEAEVAAFYEFYQQEVPQGPLHPHLL